MRNAIIQRTIYGMLAVLMVFSLVTTAWAGLNAVGPIDPTDHFPMWYEDQANGLKLELCLNAQFCAPNPVVAGNAWSATTGFGRFANYWSADARIRPNAAGVSARFKIALQASYANPNTVPRDGRQYTFVNLIIRVDGLPASATYTVVHPFGQKVFNPVDLIDNGDGTFSVNFVRNIPANGSGRFERVLNGTIGPFLTAVQPAPPLGFIGNVNANQTVTGSPTGNNFFRVIGPVGVNLGGPPANPHMVTARRFALEGQMATNFGLTVNRAVYGRSPAGFGRVMVEATSEPFMVIDVTGVGANLPVMTEIAPGQYSASIRFGRNDSFSPIIVTNETDQPPSAFTVEVVDLVRIAQATFTTDLVGGGTLEIIASSRDQLAGAIPVLQAFDDANALLGTLTNGSLTVPLGAAPTTVTVRSSAGGSDVKPVKVQ